MAPTIPPVAHARRFTHLVWGQIHVRAAGLFDDEVIGRLAGLQHGVVSRRQLLELGIGPRSIEYRLAHGRLRRVHSGVYAVGHPALSYEGRVAAAVLAMGTGAVASHRTAASLRAIEKPSFPVHVTVPQRREAQPGIMIHRGTPPRDEVEVVKGIPTTTVARTLLDCSGVLRPSRIRRLVKQAEFLGLTDARALVAILQRYPRRQGRPGLAEVVRSVHLGTGKSRSEMEDLFLDFLVARQLPLPERNVVLRVGGHTLEVDCLWREARLVVELDGREAHSTDTAFQDDRARDRILIAARWWPMRITWEQLHMEPDALETDIRSIIDQPPAGRRLR